jgi:hypothetical protein
MKAYSGRPIDDVDFEELFGQRVSFRMISTYGVPLKNGYI